MSFDLAVMHVPASTTTGEADALYIELCEGNIDVVEPSENIDGFYRELVNKYPDIDSYSDDQVDTCPWSVELDISDGAVVICIVWSRVEEVAPFVMNLAAKYDLACYDPQESKLWLPPSLPVN